MRPWVGRRASEIDDYKQKTRIYYYFHDLMIFWPRTTHCFSSFIGTRSTFG